MLAHKCTSFLPATAAITVREADDRSYYVLVQRLDSENIVWRVADVEPARRLQPLWVIIPQDYGM